MKMRMWMCDPIILCDRHLYGEHGEIHKHRHLFERGYSVKKRVELNQIEPMALKERHDQLAAEIDRRSVKKASGGHNSPFTFPHCPAYPVEEMFYQIDRARALDELLDRCTECRIRFCKYGA